jgi:cytoskeletal protein CcmA (bactofilin family)
LDKLGNKTIISSSASFIGKIINAGVIDVHGKVSADLSTEKITISETGQFRGAIRAELVVISGDYDGQMEAGSVWATSTARISGKLQYKTLQMDRGAALNCHVLHNWDTQADVTDKNQETGPDKSLPGIGSGPKLDNKNSSRKKGA